MKTCGFCRMEVADDAILCRGCNAYKLKHSYKMGKLVQAYAGSMLIPLAAAAAGYVWVMHLPKILFVLAGACAVIGLYFLVAVFRIKKQWDWWHRH